MIRPIIVAPHPSLKTVAKPITTVTDEVRTLLDDMVETMYHGKGCGLAANQINLLARLVVMDCDKDSQQPMRLINPEIFWKSEETGLYKEGCLSFPDTFVEVQTIPKSPGKILGRTRYGKRSII